jgi:hypothetical protein
MELFFDLIFVAAVAERRDSAQHEIYAGRLVPICISVRADPVGMERAHTLFHRVPG